MHFYIGINNVNRTATFHSSSSHKRTRHTGTNDAHCKNRVGYWRGRVLKDSTRKILYYASELKKITAMLENREFYFQVSLYLIQSHLIILLFNIAV